jgi:hypothetical protein
MSVNEARLIVSIEDPRTREQRQLGIEVSLGPVARGGGGVAFLEGGLGGKDGNMHQVEDIKSPLHSMGRWGVVARVRADGVGGVEVFLSLHGAHAARPVCEECE